MHSVQALKCAVLTVLYSTANWESINHIKDNLNILDFKLTDEEMAKIAELDKDERYYHRTDEQLVQFAGWRPTFEKA